MRREGDEEADGGRTEKQRYKGAEQGTQRRRDEENDDGEKEERKILYRFQQCKNTDYHNQHFLPLLPPPLTDSGEAGNNADYHNCLKCV